MGYDLLITRAQGWVESELHPISFDEWLDYVARDPELEIDERQLGYGVRGFAMWTAWSQHTEESPAWLDWFEGAVFTKHPDSELRGKMFRIAQALGAKLVGDEGERYGADGEAIDRPERATSTRRPWWRRLFGG